MSIDALDQNFYEILEITTDATIQQIERAYRIARATYQPTSTATYTIFSDEENQGILERIDEACAVLSDPRLRREYDARLRREAASGAGNGRSETLPGVRDPVPRGLMGSEPEPELDELEPDDGVYDGSTLHRARISRGIELEEIAAITKISETYLTYIEADRYQDLPAPVYVRGFVRELAKCLRLSPKLVVESYMARYEKGMERG